jgi:hypothetical protein
VVGHPQDPRKQHVASVSTLRWLSPLVAGAVIVAWLEVAADAAHRRGWQNVSPGAHFAAAAVLFAVAGVVLSLGIAAAVGVYHAIDHRIARRWGRAPAWFGPACGAAAGAAAIAGTAFAAFSGERIRATSAAHVGPWVIMGLCGAAAAGGVMALRVLGRVLDAGSALVALGVALALLCVAAVVSRVDLGFYVSLYPRIHTAAETTAALLAWIAVVVLLRLGAGRSAGFARATEKFAAASGVVTLLFVAIEPVQSRIDEALRHAWREPVYVGRMLSRVQIASGFIRDPRGWRGATMSGVVRLRERYDIATTTRSPIWDRPTEDPAWLKDRLAALRGTRQPNVVVFYVDTLRADTARDPRVMPNTIRFASEAIDFRRAYTTGSDTLHALPGITGGSYDLFARQPRDLLRVSHDAGYRSVLMVARSAHEFLRRLLPQFEFGETAEVPDYAPGNENVWGYGADQPTSGRLVDRSLDWIRTHAGERFFLWMFHFDIHNWRELDEGFARQSGRRPPRLDESDPVWRYRAAAREVDQQFGRFLDGLRGLGLADDTVLLFVSDHGEGLGRDGFWVHSVYLWESLVHVPLLLRVPGVAPAVVSDVVSLVDVAPTLARYMAPGSDTGAYQGEDLLSYVIPDRPPRRLPLVLMSTLKEVPVRLAIIDPGAPWKLVLPLEGAVPELYDLRAKDPDAVDVSGEHRPEMLSLLNELVRTPLFPRLSEAGTHGALDQAAVDGRTAIAHEAAVAAQAALKEAEAREAQAAKEAEAAKEAAAGAGK